MPDPPADQETKQLLGSFPNLETHISAYQWSV